MKNEEARKQTIEYLDRIKEDYVFNVGNIPSVEPEYFAIVEAIKLLSQDPCEDAISRQAVLEGLASIAKAKAKSDAQKSMMGRTMFFVEQLPPCQYGKDRAVDSARYS